MVYLPKKISNIIGERNFRFDETGMSDSSVLIFDDMVLKIQSVSKFSENEHLMMNWLKNRVFVPECICDVTENDKNYLLMSKIRGKMSCEDEYMSDSILLISVLANAMKELWKVDISDCPVKNDLSTMLKDAEYRVKNDLVDTDDAEPGTFGKDGFKDPEELLIWLYDNKPRENLVLTHGDFCLPNVFINGDKFSGFVDIGRMGIADRYQDIALCYRSLKHNSYGRFNEKKYGGYDDDMFFNALGIEPDYDKIKYYILLDELF